MTATHERTPLPLAPGLPVPDIFVNERCAIFEREGMRDVWISGTPAFRYHRDDDQAERLFIAQAIETQVAKAGELAAALSRTTRTVHRIRKLYVEAGLDGVVLKKRGPKGTRLGQQREQAIKRWAVQGLSNREMARRLGVTHPTVASALGRLGMPRSRSQRQQHLFDPRSAADEQPEQTVTGEPETGAPSEPGHEVCRPQAETGSIDQPQPAATHTTAQPSTNDQRGATQTDTTPQVSAVTHKEPDVVVSGDRTVGDSDTVEAKTAESASPEQQPAEAGPDTAQDAYVPATLDTDPTDRWFDRLLAAEGKLDDAAPLFGSGEGVPRAGVLLAIPLIVASGLFDAGRKVYGNIGPAFYGLRTTLLTLVFLALVRIKHPDNLKEYSPPELGRVLGLDRSPEVKTLRRKLARLADNGKSEAFLQELVRCRVESRSQALGFLYVDGHVRAYNGKADLPKTHVARIRISMPATQDVWLNDANGDPLFFVTQRAHPQLVSALPPVLRQVRRLVGKRRVTVVFDRGGWSPELFRKMFNAGFDVLTYRKGKSEPVADDAFTTYPVPGTDGKQTYELHEAQVPLLKGKFWMRQVTRKKGDHQTKIMTTRLDLEPVEIARRMFNRWRQENYFKYMIDQYAIDALVEYGTEPDDASRLVPNPARKAVEKRLRKAKRELEQLEAAYGAAASDNPENKRPTMRGFKIAHGTDIGIPLRQAKAQVQQLEQQRSELPSKVPVGDIKDEVVRLPLRRKRLSDSLKMLAYQVESDLVRAVASYYARSVDEGRPLVRAALKSAGEIEVTDNELRVTLDRQYSPHRSKAIAKLCEILNDTDTCFPGTSLRLRFAVEEHECAT